MERDVIFISRKMPLLLLLLLLHVNNAHNVCNFNNNDNNNNHSKEERDGWGDRDDAWQINRNRKA